MGGPNFQYFKVRERGGADVKSFDTIHLQLGVELLGPQLVWFLDTQASGLVSSSLKVRGWLAGRLYILYKGTSLLSSYVVCCFQRYLFLGYIAGHC